MRSYELVPPELSAASQAPASKMDPEAGYSEESEDSREIEAKSALNRRIRMLALSGLVLQNSALVLTMKKASLSPSADGKKALTSTMVVMVELFKVCACALAIAYRRRQSGGLMAELREEIVGKPRETLMLLVPSFLYLAQNNLLFIAVANLEAVVYMVLSQLKILTTAAFSIIILSRSLSRQKWSALFLLTVGCAVVQTDQSGDSGSASVGESRLLGVTCSLLAVCTSGFAGVFVEKMVKGGGSMAVRNIQLGIPALFLGLGNVLLSDAGKLSDGGFFQGYTVLTCMVILLHAGGGLLVTVIMKYADNIAKTIAVALSLVLSTAISTYLFAFQVTLQFTGGAFLVIAATFFYSVDDVPLLLRGLVSGA